MKITKYEHACLVVEENGKRLVIDPGVFVRSLPQDLDNVSGIVITHVHQDHLDQTQLDNLLQHNPDAKIFGTEEVAKELSSRNINVVTGGDAGEVGPFKLQFFGNQHAIVDSEQSAAQNVGVYINKTFYYPGDSLITPSESINTLALPTSGPWIKTRESLDLMRSTRPKAAFPTHDAMLSDAGESMTNDWLKQASEKIGTKFQALKPGQSIDI